MYKYIVNDNFVEHEMNGDKYLLKISDSDIRYPKLYILNNTSYDIYRFVYKNPNSSLDSIFLYILNKYPFQKEIIKKEDIEACINDFVSAEIFQVKELV